MSVTTDLISTVILEKGKNSWIGGDSNANMSLIVRDVETCATAIDAINSGTVTLTDVTVANGTAAAPTVNFTGSTTTGLYRSAANEMGITTAGVGQVIFADGAIKPVTDNDVDLGTASLEFKDLYIDGTANIDSLVADTADINAGTVDAVIGGTTPAAGTFTTAAATTFDTNVAAAGVTLAGTTLAADGTDANINITVTPKGTGGLVLPSGAVATPSIQIGTETDGFYRVGVNQLGVSVNNALATMFETTGVVTDSVLARVNLGTTPVGTVSINEFSNGKDVTTELTLTNFIVGAIPGAGNLGVGNIVYAFPAGQHFELVYSLSDIVLTVAGTTVSTDTGLGSVIASGAVTVLSGTATFEDRLTGQTISAEAAGGAAVNALTAATAGIGTGISLNVAASVKNVFLNSAGAWNADNAGDLTATGVIVLKWTLME